MKIESFLLIAGLFCAMASTLQAGSRTSTNYNIVADSIDAGGVQVTSANYGNSGSAGGVSGLATVSSPSETMKSGYVGQLYQIQMNGLVLAPTFTANGFTQQLDATETLDDGTSLVLMGGTWSAQGLPAALSLNQSTGVVSGTITNPGMYSFTVTVSDGLGNSAMQTFTGTVLSELTFGQWEAQPHFFTVPQQNDPTISGPTIVYEKDGVPNLLKYVYNINPAHPMAATDRAALPVLDIPTSGASSGDLTLTFREYSLLDTTGVTINVQTSNDLKNWSSATQANQDQTLPPPAGMYTIQQTGTDTNTNDPYMKIDFKPNGTPARVFIRLSATLH